MPSRSSTARRSRKIYKGLAIAARGSARFLYAADFHNGVVDVFDSTFTPVGASRRVHRSHLARRLRAVRHPGDRQPHLRHAMPSRTPTRKDEVAGAGLGVVDVFDTGGKLVQRLVPRGAS